MRPVGCAAGGISRLPGQELAHRRADLAGVGLQREMAAIDEADVGRGHVALEGLGARRNEERVVLAPHRQHRRALLAQIGLDRVVQRDVGLVVEQEIELDLVVARPRQIEVIEVAAVRRNQARVGDAVRVLEQRGLRRQEAAQRVAVGLGRLVPVGLDRRKASDTPSR